MPQEPTTSRSFMPSRKTRASLLTNLALIFITFVAPVPPGIPNQVDADVPRFLSVIGIGAVVIALVRNQIRKIGLQRPRVAQRQAGIGAEQSC